MTADRPLTTPIELQAALNVGTVESVAPGRITVRLELDAPQTTALNTGTPTAFPRLNGFVVVPNESGALVGIVVWLGVEPSYHAKRPGLKDFDLVDLPFPLRKMHLVPIGTLERRTGGSEGQFRLRRGVVTFPSVGDPVALPSSDQLDSLTRGEPADRRVPIGRALLGNDAEIRVDPDKLFGRHLAVLGNTGSGKSCSVAGLIRWSIESASAERTQIGKAGTPNSRFIVLDPNGEYREALDDLPGFKLFQVPPMETSVGKPLGVPAWLLNSSEWASVTFASARVQRPVLVQALRNLRLGLESTASAEEQLATLILSYRTAVSGELNAGPEYWAASFPGRMSTGGLLASLQRTLGQRLDPAKPWSNEAQALLDHLNDLESQLLRNGYWGSFDHGQLAEVLTRADALLEQLPAPVLGSVGNEDTPVKFDPDLLADQLDVVVSSGSFEDAARYIGGLRMRVRSLLNDERIRPILRQEEGQEPPLEEWLGEFLGDGTGSSVAVIDLSLVPSDVIEIVIAVVARMLFEALQRHRRVQGQALPTALVLEEAHTFVRQHGFNEDHTTPGELCVRSFERIAREGRKFGLGVVISSQRPSELSPTILAQCNSFLLHRLVNDRDQQLVAKLVPDNLSDFLEDLPSLPTRHAMLLGWASALPTLLEVRELPEHQRPRSADPDFWNVWTGGRDPDVDWTQVADRWLGR
jgi:uncharacterized protein